MRLPLLILFLFALAGCGSSEATSPVKYQGPRYTESDVSTALKLTSEDSGLSYQTPSGCEIAVILTGRPQVEMYAGAGDTVASTPDREAGVKIVGDNKEACFNEITAELQTLKP